MSTIDNQEINRGYVDHIVKTGKLNDLPQRNSLLSKIRHFIFGVNKIRLLALPFLLVYGLFLVIGLALYKLLTRRELSHLHRESLRNIDEFVPQYPMHLYPIIAKSLEIVFLKEKIKPHLHDKTVEIAIGEGTLSKRVFEADAKVVGLDLNPYSLTKTNALSHVVQRVICDCLKPPIAPDSFDLLVANNFLHHINDKRTTLANWSKIAQTAIFNENTPYWASCWTTPYIVSHLGFKKWGAKIAKNIELHSLQALETEETLAEIVNEFYEVKEQASYLDKNTYFLCSIFSFLMRCFGPPTPEKIKKILLGPLRPIALFLTRKSAQLLIYFDSQRTRKHDVFISYYCKSKNFKPDKSHDVLVCPECKKVLQENFCIHCQRKYLTIDEMLFLVPDNFQHIIEAYRTDIAETISAEHL